jgi:hypothetical protein
MSSSLPTKMQAFAQHDKVRLNPFTRLSKLNIGTVQDRAALVQEVPVPSLEANDILIKVSYAAQVRPTTQIHRHR